MKKSALLALVVIISSSTLVLLVAMPCNVGAVPETLTKTTKVSGFEHGQYYNITMNNMTPGMMILWSWGARSNLTFFVEAPDSSYPFFHSHQNYSNLEVSGMLVDQTGDYLIGWRSEDANASLSYTLQAFTPVVKISNPVSGSSLNELNPVIQGTCDSFVKGIDLIKNGNVTHGSIYKGIWTSRVALEPGANHYELISSYEYGNFSCSHSENVSLYADNQWVYYDNGALQVGSNLMILMSSIVTAELLLFIYIHARLK